MGVWEVRILNGFTGQKKMEDPYINNLAKFTVHFIIQLLVGYLNKSACCHFSMYTSSALCKKIQHLATETW